MAAEQRVLVGYLLAQKFAVCEASCVPEGTWRLFFSADISG